MENISVSPMGQSGYMSWQGDDIPCLAGLMSKGQVAKRDNGFKLSCRANLPHRNYIIINAILQLLFAT